MTYPKNKSQEDELRRFLSNVAINPEVTDIPRLKKDGKMVINPPKQECSACHR